jgi:hypothetical protein
MSPFDKMLTKSTWIALAITVTLLVVVFWLAQL